MWTSLSIPKHVIVSWMTVLNRLPTMDRMLRWGLEIDGKCRLCQDGMESRDHLFFECSFAKEVWRSVLQMYGLNKGILPWNEELNWAIQNFKGKSLISVILRLAWKASIYYIWRERNGRMHNKMVETPRQIVRHIQSDIKLRATGLKSIKNDSVNCFICHNWGLEVV